MADNDLSPATINQQSDINFYSSEKKLVIILESADNRENATFDNKVDIRKSIRIDLANYISKETVIAHNQFPVAPSNGDAGSVTLRTQAGNPAPLIAPGRNGQSNYIDSAAPNAKIAFNETSATKQLNTDQDGPFVIKKGKSETIAPTGDEIYRSIDIQKDNAPFVQRVQRVLIDNTHYNANEPFISDPGSTNENDIKVATVSYNTLGLFGPRKYPTSTPDITENNIVSIREMKRIGLLTLLAGAGDITPALPANKTTDAWFGEVANATSLVPGLGRLGVKFPVSRFDANEVVKTMKPNFVRPTNTQFLDGKTNYTNGNSNTPFAPFAGLNSVASIASATILTATVGGLLFAFSQIRYRRRQQINHSKNTAQSRYNFLGSSDGTSGDRFDFPLLDLPKIKHEFFSCLNEGIKVFFGFETQPNIGGTAAALQILGGSSEKIINAHGYFNTILRQIVRGASDLIGGVGASFGVGQGASFEPKADQIFNQFDPDAVLERLKGQPIVKFINILVTIGDRMIDRQGSLPEDASIEDTISIIDSIAGEKIEDNSAIEPAILIAKNRLSEFNNRSTMAMRNKRSLLMMPISQSNDATLLGSEANPSLAISALTADNKIVFENRIDPDTVKAFEDYLEKDYMPFYFQDLRTNEILSFHAFVGDLNESLNAEYNETEGYGRIGTVPIYKNTKRNIGFSFYVVSTSEEDFDDMWYKINRLATMLFPQWSEGRRVDFAGNKFTQPFSQVPAASPLIRFRIGDLWKANYSKFSVARLFGLSSNVNEFKIGDMRDVPSSINNQQIATNAESIRRRRQNNTLPLDQRYHVGEVIRISNSAVNSNGRSPTNTIFRLADGASIGSFNQSNARRNRRTFGVQTGNVPIPSSVNADTVTTEWLEPTEFTELTIQRIVNGSQDTESYIVATVSSPRGATFSHLSQRGNSQRRIRSAPGGESFVVPVDVINNSADLIHAQAVLETQRQQPSDNPNQNTNSQQNSAQVQQFFADSGNNSNPIMKAFKTTEGRGIAGFIRNMTFDYTQSTWETEKFGGRAPKFLKIQIEFLPIWDVNPGLDFKGGMTAPIWNVGKIVNNYHGGNGLTQTSKNSFISGKQKIKRF